MVIVEGFPDQVWVILVVTEFEKLIRRMEMALDDASRSRKRVYGPRHRLRRDMVAGHPIFELFISGSSTGSDKLSLHDLPAGRVHGVAGAAEFS